MFGRFFQGSEPKQDNGNDGFRIVTQGYQVVPGNHVQPPLPRSGSSVMHPAPNIVYYPVVIDPQK